MSVETEIHCNDCDRILGDTSHFLVNADFEYVCDECAVQYCDCADCECRIRVDSPFKDDHGNPVCESCGGHYHACDRCESVGHDDEIYYLDRYGIYVCDSCINEHYERCDTCDQYVREEDSYVLAGGGHICNGCFERGDYSSCASCGDIYSSSELNYDENSENDYCNHCYSERGSQSERIIHCYSYKPNWQYHITKQEKQRNGYQAFYLGIELEVQNTSDGVISNENAAMAVTETAPVICKYDGSITNGFEIVFHPQTYQYAVTEGKRHLENCLSELRSLRFSGHNYGGMHVHVSLAAFTRLHLVKFHLLFKNASGLLTRLSQRKLDKLDQWASFANMANSPGQSCERYAALNYTNNTVEVRIFNSTLRTNRFFKNLEVVKAAVDYSKFASLGELDSTHFLRHIMRNRAIYRNLAGFLVEKHETLTTAASGERVVREVQKQFLRRAG